MEIKKPIATPASQKKVTPEVAPVEAEAVKEEVVETPVDQVEDEQATLLVYRHKAVSRFSCAGFEFVDHLCYVKEKEEKRFLAVYESLNRKDQINIVRLPAAPVELPVYRDENKGVTRGPTTAPVKKR